MKSLKKLLFHKNTCFSEHNDDGVQINFATHMAESNKPLHVSMSVFLCDQNNTIAF